MDFSRDTFLNHLAQTTDSPALIAVTYAEGIYIYDTDNKRYTDLISGIGVT
jgi:adenosylmethionine-8-amino-7-oxononanoate aminotransferase